MTQPVSKHALIFVFTTVLLDMIGFGIIMPVLPALLMEVTGEPLSSAASYGGYLLTAYAALQFLFAPILGALSDRFGRRPVLLLSLAAYAVNYLIAGFATTLAWLFLGRVMTGIAGATHATANALVADVTPPEQRAQNFGLLGMAFGLGFVIGPALGGYLGEISPRMPFFAAAALAGVNLVYGAIVLPETLPPSERRAFSWVRANPFGALARLAKFPTLIGLALVMFIYNIGHHVYPSIWAFFTMERFAWDSGDVGWSLALVGLTMAIVQGGLIRVLIPKLGAARVALLGFLASSVAFVGTALVTTVPLLTLCIVASGLSGLIGPAVQGIMSSQVPQNEQGELQGVLASLGSVAAIVGPLTMTQLFHHYTDSTGAYFPGAPFVAAALLSIVALLLFAANARQELFDPRRAESPP